MKTKTTRNSAPISATGSLPAGGKLARVERKSLSATVLDHLRAAIHDGRYLPGERLVEQNLAEVFDVSRGPIRDALRDLEREGLVTSETNRGTFVARLKYEDLQEIYSLRTTLDQLAMELACQNADGENLQEMETVIERMETSVNEGLSERDAVELDLQFHDAVYRASDHSRLCFFWETLRPQIKVLLLERVTEVPDYADIIVPFHKRLLDVISDRDEQRARELMSAHSQSSYQPLAQHRERTQPAGGK
jgi:DNA-binding GntR family transcriptional regulator